MLIGQFSKKPMAAESPGDAAPDVVDLNGNLVSVEMTDGHVAIGIEGRGLIFIDIPQAEELGLAVLALVERRAGLSYSIRRCDAADSPPVATEAERSLARGILFPHIEDPDLRAQVGDELIRALR